MNKSDVSRMLNNVKTTLSKRSPEILTGIGIAGMFTTTVLAVTATPKAIKLIEEQKETLDVDKLTVMETVKTTWKCYIPAATTAVASSVCLIGANSVHSKRNAALATAYKLSETALTKYREKVIETIGENKERTVREKVAKDKIDNDPVSKTEVFITERGNTLCYDAVSGRYFKSDIERIKSAVNTLNKQMLTEMYVSLNEFYDELGLSPTNLGDKLGWKLDKGLIELDFSSQIADDGTPCIVVDYRVTPDYDYDKLM